MQTQPNDVNNQYTLEVKKLNSSVKRTYRPYFYDGSGIYANINLDPEIIRQLAITSETDLTQQIFTTSDGRRGILVLER